MCAEILDVPIGIRVKNFRESQSLTRKAFAEKYHLDIDNYYKWERGTNPSDPEDYKKLENILINVPHETPKALYSLEEMKIKNEEQWQLIKSQQDTIRMLTSERFRPPEEGEKRKNA